LARLEPDAQLRAALRAEPDLRERLFSVLGASAGLGEHLARHRGDWQVLRGPGALRRRADGELRPVLLSAVGAMAADRDPVSDPARLGGADPATSLRAAYRRCLLHLAGRDLTGADPLDWGMAELAALASAALEAALAVARTTSAGRRRGKARRCSRPGPRPATRASLLPTWRRRRRWSGRPPSARASSPTSGQCAAGSSAACRPTVLAVSSSSDPAACGTSNSPCSCSRWCTAAPMRCCGFPARWPRSTRWPAADTSAAAMQLTLRPPTGSCAPSSTCSSCGSYGARTRFPRIRRCCG